MRGIASIVELVVIVIMLVAYLVGALISHDALAFVQAAVTAVLTVIITRATVRYADLTERITNANERSVELLERQRELIEQQRTEMTLTREEMARQREASARPVLVLEITNPDGGFTHPHITVYNIGQGPALDIHVQVVLAPEAAVGHRRSLANEERTIAGLAGGVKHPDSQEFVCCAIPPNAAGHMLRAWLIVWYDDVFGNAWRSMLPLQWNMHSSRVETLRPNVQGVITHDEP